MMTNKKILIKIFYKKLPKILRSQKCMMINFGSLVQIGIRDNSLKLCEKERKKEKNNIFFFFFLSFDPIEKRKYFFFFLSISHNLGELSLIPIRTREPKFIIMDCPFGNDKKNYF